MAPVIISAEEWQFHCNHKASLDNYVLDPPLLPGKGDVSEEP